MRTVLIAIGLLSIYLFILFRVATETRRRSVSLEVPPESADYLSITVSVVHVDLLRSEMTTRIDFQLYGKMGQDAITPTTDLHLLLNTVRGQQEFTFPKGERMNPIEAVFPMKGEANNYPFDRYKETLWFFLTVPEPKKGSSIAGVSPEEIASSPGLVVDTSALKKRTLADMKVKFTAAIPGLKFLASASPSAQSVKGQTGIEVNVQRSMPVMTISVLTMLMMAATALGLVAMVWKILTGKRRADAFHMTMAVSLMFGLPALRNVQPGIPPIGTLGDAMAFTWAEIAVAGSVIALIGSWLFQAKVDTKD